MLHIFTRIMGEITRCRGFGKPSRIEFLEEIIMTLTEAWNAHLAVDAAKDATIADLTAKLAAAEAANAESEAALDENAAIEAAIEATLPKAPAAAPTPTPPAPAA